MQRLEKNVVEQLYIRSKTMMSKKIGEYFEN